MSSTSERRLRLDTLTRHLTEQPAGSDAGSVVVLALGFLAVMVFELLVVVPAAVSIARS